MCKSKLLWCEINLSCPVADGMPLSVKNSKASSKIPRIVWGWYHLWGGHVFYLSSERSKKKWRCIQKKGKDREHWKLTVPLLQVMVYHGVATVLYFTAFVTNAASVDPFSTFFHWYYNNLAAASVRHYWSSLTHENNVCLAARSFPAVFHGFNVKPS